MDYSRFSRKHRVMMWMMKKMLSKKKLEDLTEEDQGILETYGKHVDFTDRDSILPLVQDVRQYI